MHKHLNTVFHYYEADIQQPTPIGVVTLRQFLKRTKNPKKEILELFSQIEDAAKIGDLDLKDKLKSKLYYFTPCVVMNGNGRSYSDIVSFTGLLVLDFDKIDNAVDFKNFLFNANKSIIAAYTSPSKKGVKFIVSIPVCKTTDEFKSYFYGLGFYLEKYAGWDGTAQNCSLPLYLSYDTELLYRQDAEVWTQKGEKVDEFKPYEGEIEVLENVSPEDVIKVKNILSKSLEKIIDAGHPVVRGTSLSAGGYVSAGYLSEGDAIVFLETKIRNIKYLQKNLHGYIKTMKAMVRKGMTSPLYLK